MKTRTVTDVSSLPPYGFGTSASSWWGTLGFCAIEGTGFALAIGMYLFLAFNNPHWPIGFAPPRHWPGTALTILLLLSIIPNVMVDRAAHAHDLPKVRRLLVLLSAIGVLGIALRFVEFTMLIPRWDSNAYGSIIWFLLGLHATHLITDVGDSVVLTALMFTKHGRAKRFADVSDNAFYWYFVVAAWLPIYYLVYWFPIL
jgi:heme/copper-type cytochrome/quinol oxidase subunit 3